jgi:hypothetical protein
MNPYQLVRSLLTDRQRENEVVLTQWLGRDMAQHVSSIAVIDPVKTTQRHFRRSRKIQSNNKKLYLFYNNLTKLEKAVRTHQNLTGIFGIGWLQTIKPQLLDFIATYQEDDTYTTKLPGINEKLQELREKINSITTEVPSGDDNINLRSLIRSIMRLIYDNFSSDTLLLTPVRSERATQVYYPPMGQGFKKKEKKKTKKARKARKARKETPKKKMKKVL